MPREGVVGGVGAACGGQRGDEDRLKRDEDLAEGGILHQQLETLEMHTHAEVGTVPIHLHREA